MWNVVYMVGVGLVVVGYVGLFVRVKSGKVDLREFIN